MSRNTLGTGVKFLLYMTWKSGSIGVSLSDPRIVPDPGRTSLVRVISVVRPLAKLLRMKLLGRGVAARRVASALLR